MQPATAPPDGAFVISVLALIVALGGVAYSAIPDPMGVIHGCYTNSGRTLRVIDSTAAATAARPR